MITKLSKWILVPARPVNRRHRNIQHPQIDGELSAVMIGMIHQDRTQKSDPGHGHQGLPISRQSPSDMSRASSMFFNTDLALATLLEKVSRISCRLLASARAKLGASAVSCEAAAAIWPGPDAMCRANCPKEDRG